MSSKTLTTITLYAEHGCPFAHRAYITLHESGLPYEDVIIDLDKPREPWYLEINARGLVPSLHIKHGGVDTIITESENIAWFIADAFPSHLMPPPDDVKTSLFRARVRWFADTYRVKVHDKAFGMIKCRMDEEGIAIVKEIVRHIQQEIEPHLLDAAPFFGGSAYPTLAEVIVGTHVLRAHSWSRHGLTPRFIHEQYSTNCPVYWKWAQKVMEITSFHVTWNEESALLQVKKRMSSHAEKIRKEVETERLRIYNEVREEQAGKSV
ncbi:thioredoxin-like protein [Aspergillus insuetus]